MADRRPRGVRWRGVAAVVGPGLVVMLADTDVGSIVTAAESGAHSGYRLLLLQFLLVPLLYVVQELTVRLGVVTGESHATLLLRHCGRAWTALSVLALLLACAGALVTELGGLAGVGAMVGVPVPLTLGVAVLALMLAGGAGRVLSFERVALAVGAFELGFLLIVGWARPRLADVMAQIATSPLADPRDRMLVAANIGTAIAPWMIYYQQSAVVAKRLTPKDLPVARIDTALGAVVAQGLMAAVLAAAAATSRAAPQAPRPVTMGQIADALAPVLGTGPGRLVFVMAIAGAALVAALVVTLTVTRTLADIVREGEARHRFVGGVPWGVALPALIVVSAAGIVLSGVDIVGLSIGVQVMNAVMLPLVLGGLFHVARRLPPPYRLHGGPAVIVGLLMAATALTGLYASLASM